LAYFTSEMYKVNIKLTSSTYFLLVQKKLKNWNIGWIFIFVFYISYIIEREIVLSIMTNESSKEMRDIMNIMDLIFGTIKILIDLFMIQLFVRLFMYFIT
jgi:hypothetical protein